MQNISSPNYQIHIDQGLLKFLTKQILMKLRQK